MRRRWDVDERGHGVASAERYLPHADDLRAAMTEPDWVAEEPEHHLLPHVERFCAASRVLALERWAVEDGVLVLDVASAAPTWRARRDAVWALLGTFAEPATLVRELVQDREFAVVTGVLEGDSEFAPHGHTVLLRVGGPSGAK